MMMMMMMMMMISPCGEGGGSYIRLSSAGLKAGGASWVFRTL
jgi:hypothetical protein